MKTSDYYQLSKIHGRFTLNELALNLIKKGIPATLEGLSAYLQVKKTPFETIKTGKMITSLLWPTMQKRKIPETITYWNL